MTIEASLRRRAQYAHRLALGLISSAVFVLAAGYFSLVRMVPLLIKDAQPSEKMVMIFLSIGVAAIGAACYLLARAAFIELEISARLSGAADALCLAGADSAELEKVAAILIPKSKYFSLSSPELSKELNTLLSIARK